MAGNGEGCGGECGSNCPAAPENQLRVLQIVEAAGGNRVVITAALQEAHIKPCENCLAKVVEGAET